MPRRATGRGAGAPGRAGEAFGAACGAAFCAAFGAADAASIGRCLDVACLNACSLAKRARANELSPRDIVTARMT
ncbi:hypothetical protein WS81_09115 [Burkholderia sp. MSMB2040]|nr:hypothetical protein WS81_09115 [Burkholderia sp. MSMB2040]